MVKRRKRHKAGNLWADRINLYLGVTGITASTEGPVQSLQDLYLCSQHLLLGLDLLLLARRHFLKLSKSQIHPGAVNLRKRTQRSQMQDQHGHSSLGGLWKLPLSPTGHSLPFSSITWKRSLIFILISPQWLVSMEDTLIYKPTLF